MTKSDITALFGVDGARGGWVVTRALPDLTCVELRIEQCLDRLFRDVVDQSGLLAIDIPIGLPESGPRECDRAARRLLGQPRGSSVFPAPMRAALDANSYADACRVNEAACGKRLSRQSFGILPKIRAVDAAMTPDRQTCVREAHPEVSFMFLSGQQLGLRTNKKRSAGRAQRRAILQGWLPAVDIEALTRAIPRHIAHHDDLLDALACLVTAWRIANDRAVALPEGEPHFDSRGLRMGIVA